MLDPETLEKYIGVFLLNMMKRRIEKIFKNMGFLLRVLIVYFLILIVLNFMMKYIVIKKIVII